MRIHPEIYIVEEAKGFAWIRRQQRTVKGRSRAILPGALAHIETSGKGEPYAEVENHLRETPPCAGSGASQ